MTGNYRAKNTYDDEDSVPEVVMDRRTLVLLVMEEVASLDGEDSVVVVLALARALVGVMVGAKVAAVSTKQLQALETRVGWNSVS